MSGINVVYGADEDEFNSLEGVEFQTAVGMIRNMMSIPTEIDDIRLNGNEHPLATTILRRGDTITFYKQGGRKGC